MVSGYHISSSLSPPERPGDWQLGLGRRLQRSHPANSLWPLEALGGQSYIFTYHSHPSSHLVAQTVKKLPALWETRV